MIPSTDRECPRADASKILAAGVELRPVEEALADALKNWVPLQ
jgi:hypothetical protein